MNFRFFKGPPTAEPSVKEFMPSLCRSGSLEETSEGQQHLCIAVTLNIVTSINPLILRNKGAFCV